MNDEKLLTYVHDHLLGSASGLGLAQRLASRERGTEAGLALDTLVTQIREERAVLGSVARRLGGDPAIAKQLIGVAGGAAAWVRDRLPLGSRPTLLEELEALAVGVWGKRLLWGTLARASEHDARVGPADFDRLALAAEDQEKALLALREQAITETLEL